MCYNPNSQSGSFYPLVSIYTQVNFLFLPSSSPKSVHSLSLWDSGSKEILNKDLQLLLSIHSIKNILKQIYCRYNSIHKTDNVLLFVWMYLCLNRVWCFLIYYIILHSFLGKHGIPVNLRNQLVPKILHTQIVSGPCFITS